MKTQPRQWILPAVASALLMAASAFGLGFVYPNDKPVNGSGRRWPKGMEALVNATNRVWGYAVNAEDTFFFSGGAPELTAFLRGYSRLEGIEDRRLILHDGIGEAKAPWENTGRPCDWKVYLCPKGWHNAAVLLEQRTNSVEVIQKAGKEPGYVVEVHFWTGGHIAINQLDVPKNVVVERGK